MPTDFTFVPKHYAARNNEKMKEVLMDPEAPSPAIHYYMIRGGVDQKNITVWEPGTVGGEYIKTYGHYHVGKLDETYWTLFGEGIILLQKLVVDENGEMIMDVVEEFKVIPVKVGDSVFIPAGYGHLAVNIGKTYFVTVDDSPVDFEEKDPAGLPGHADYELVKKMHGFAYYVVENNGQPALKKNPLYKEVKNINTGGIAGD